MTIDLAKVKAQLEREKSDLENAKVVTDAVKQVIFMEYTKSSKFKQLRQGMVRKAVVHICTDLRSPKLDLGFMERKYNLELVAPR